MHVELAVPPFLLDAPSVSLASCGECVLQIERLPRKQHAVDALHESDIVRASQDTPVKIGHVLHQDGGEKLQVSKPKGSEPGLELAEVLQIRAALLALRSTGSDQSHLYFPRIVPGQKRTQATGSRLPVFVDINDAIVVERESQHGI